MSSLSSFVVDYLVYAIAILFLPTAPTSFRIFLANGLARVTSSVFNYSTNKKLVFKNDDSLVKTGMGYFGLAAGLFVLDTLLIRLFFYSLWDQPSDCQNYRRHPSLRCLLDSAKEIDL